MCHGTFEVLLLLILQDCGSATQSPRLMASRSTVPFPLWPRYANAPWVKGSLSRSCVTARPRTSTSLSPASRPQSSSALAPFAPSPPSPYLARHLVAVPDLRRAHHPSQVSQRVHRRVTEESHL